MRVAVICVCVLTALMAVSARAAAPGQELTAHVLRLQDLPQGFKTYASFRRNAKVAASDNGSSLSDYGAWGFRGGWEVTFVPSGEQIHVGSAVVPGPQAVWASADLYRDVSGAERAFAASRTRCKVPPPSLRLNHLTIGDEAVLCRLHAAFGGNPPPGVIPYEYTVSWRRGQVIGAIRIAALKGGLPASKLVQLALALAEKQDKRMA
jgi:hypothetical protein